MTGKDNTWITYRATSGDAWLEARLVLSPTAQVTITCSDQERWSWPNT
ncbi:hypothetical protein [Propioniciclava flava]